MLNGKFYTGLPAGMMDRRNGPNRQKSHFFWPDESTMESADSTRTKLRNSSRLSITPERVLTKEMSPVELHKKELASKINLTENLPKPRVAVAPLKSVDKPTQIKRRDTFTSKIRFYDYDDDARPAVPKTNKNSKVEVEKNLKNSPKTTDKRISFAESKPRARSPAVNGILKNNESAKRTARSTPIAKNLSKSKSMTDIAAHDNVRVIENNVKNIAITQEKNNERIEDFLPPRKPSRGIQLGRHGRPITEYLDDFEEIPDYPENRRQAPEKYSRSVLRNNDIEADYDYHDVIPSNERTRNTRQSYSRTIERRGDIDGHNYVEDLEYNYDRYGHQSPNQNFCEDTVRSRVRKNDRNMSLKSPKQIDQTDHEPVDAVGIDEGQKPNNLYQTRNTTMPPTTQTPNRAHRHLVSNISFGDSSANNPPSKIRSSAVTRVSVGLPDT